MGACAFPGRDPDKAIPTRDLMLLDRPSAIRRALPLWPHLQTSQRRPAPCCPGAAWACRVVREPGLTYLLLPRPPLSPPRGQIPTTPSPGFPSVRPQEHRGPCAEATGVGAALGLRGQARRRERTPESCDRSARPRARGAGGGAGATLRQRKGQGRLDWHSRERGAHVADAARQPPVRRSGQTSARRIGMLPYPILG